MVFPKDGVSQIVTATVTVDQLDRLNNEANRQQKEFGSTDPYFAAVKAFKPGSMPVNTMLAMVYRMEALCILLKSGKLEKWTMGQDSEGGFQVSRDLLAAAATATLTPAQNGRDIHFDACEVLRLALAAAEPEGSH